MSWAGWETLGPQARTRQGDVVCENSFPPFWVETLDRTHRHYIGIQDFSHLGRINGANYYGFIVLSWEHLTPKELFGMWVLSKPDVANRNIVIYRKLQMPGEEALPDAGDVQLRASRKLPMNEMYSRPLPLP